MKRLEENGFASTNVVFGIGSFTYQRVTRDTLGFAMKATQVTIDGEDIDIFKNPITDDGMKKSLKGRAVVYRGTAQQGYAIQCDDGVSREVEGGDTNLLTELYVDGELLRETTLAEIRNQLDVDLETLGEQLDITRPLG